MKKKTFILLLSLVLVVGCVVGGTLAWLTAESKTITNTFTTSDIKIELEESTGNEYKMIPGYKITKDPKVTVEAESEKCYLFVKLEKSTNFDKFMTYSMAEGWSVLKDKDNNVVNGVYYRVVDANDKDQFFDVIENNTVTVKVDVTKANMNALTSDTYPTLTVTAYASQFMKDKDTEFTPAEAWSNIGE